VLMELDVAAKLGADPHERTSDRLGHRKRQPSGRRRPRMPSGARPRNGRNAEISVVSVGHT
jgi:hypothetical protein